MDKNQEKDEQPQEKNVLKNLRKKLFIKNDFAWRKWDEKKKKNSREFGEKYLEFLTNARTERERVNFIIKLAEKKGFKKRTLKTKKTLKAGDKVYYVNRNKNIALIKMGKKPLDEGIRLIGAHLDTPRLDLKIRPLYDESATGTAMFKTHYYGGLKKYAWITIPLHLSGVVAKKDGTVIDIDIGKNQGDPVFTVPDILIHYARKIQEKRKAFSVVEGEEMNAIAGSLPLVKNQIDLNKEKKEGENEEEKEKGTEKKDIDGDNVKESFKFHILKLLNEKYDITEEDLQSAELSLVSGITPKYVGLDKGLIGGAGQDDGICSYTSATAILNSKETPEYTSIVALLDKEETGSHGPTGAQSAWLKFMLGSLNPDQNLGTFHQTLTNIKMISADVGAGVNPNFKSAHDLKNAAIIGKGILVEKYGGHRGKYNTNDATAEFVAEIRKIFDENEVPYQIGKPGKVDKGGGGTIAKFFAEAFNCDVIDSGTPLINMHSPFELSSIVDLYSTYLAYEAFLNSQ